MEYVLTDQSEEQWALTLIVAARVSGSVTPR